MNFEPLSELTIASLIDMGYVCDMGAADPYINHPSCTVVERKLRPKQRRKKGARLLYGDDGSKPEISQAAKERAIQVGCNVLEKNGATRSLEIVVGVTYVGSDVVEIFVQEGRFTFSVSVGIADCSR